jgi:hypothetical protein
MQFWISWSKCCPDSQDDVAICQKVTPLPRPNTACTIGTVRQGTALLSVQLPIIGLNDFSFNFISNYQEIRLLILSY